MDKSKSFAIITSVLILSIAYVAYAQTSQTFAPSSLVVTKPVQPVSGIAPAGALHVPFTNVDLTARGTDIIVNDITIVRTGVADDEAFDDILLLNPDGEEVGEGSLDDDHMVHFTDPIYIPRNTTLRLTVAANMVDDLEEFEGQIPSFTIMNISASGYLRLDKPI